MPDVDPEIADPLDSYRIDVTPSAEAIEDQARRRGERVRELFASGGPPIMLTGDALWLANDEDVYRLPRADIRGMGQVRSTDYIKMRWGIGLYLLALIAFFLHWIVTGLLILAGGTLVVLGFLSKALLVQVEDERVPPFVIEHRRWRDIRGALDAWYTADP